LRHRPLPSRRRAALGRPAYLDRIVSGRASNREPDKTRAVRWFRPDQLPPNLTMTARNAIAAYLHTTAERAKAMKDHQ
jgi:hypothetical protein